MSGCFFLMFNANLKIRLVQGSVPVLVRLAHFCLFRSSRLYSGEEICMGGACEMFLLFFSQKLLIFPLGFFFNHNSENCTFSVKKRNEKSEQSTPSVTQMHISSHVALFLCQTFDNEDFPLSYYVQNKFNGETPNYSATCLNWSGLFWVFFFGLNQMKKKKLRWT